MNNTKSSKNVSLKNQLELWLFCTLIGAVAGALVWILLKIMAVGTEFLWKWLPGKTTGSLLYDSYLCSRCGNYRYFPKNIRRLSRRSGNCYGKSQNRKKIRIQKHACNDGGSTAAITHRKQCRSRSRTYRNHRRFMLLGRRQSEV